MDEKELNLDGGILDPLELDNTPSSGGYVPKFERDLAKAGGSLDALSEAKKAEESKAAGAITADSSNSGEEYSELKAYEEKEPAPVYTENADDSYGSLEEYSAPAPVKQKYDTSDMDRSLDSVQVSADVLADMDYDSRKDSSRNLMKQMQLDSIAMDMDNKPVLAEMSTEYAPSRKKNEDLYSKASLDKDEKQIIKERLEREIGKRPEGYNKKTSLQMYHDLMNEQKVKKAKKGFFVVLLIVALGFITAAISYFKLNWNGSNLFMYLPFATAFFSLILFFKAKACKIFSSIYFAINTAVLLGPGFIKFCIDNAPQGDVTKDNLITMLFFAAAIILSAVICAQLVTNEKIEAYYATHLLTEEKKVFDEKKSKYKQ